MHSGHMGLQSAHQILRDCLKVLLGAFHRDIKLINEFIMIYLIFLVAFRWSFPEKIPLTFETSRFTTFLNG